MADIIIGGTGSTREPVKWPQVGSDLVMSIRLSTGSSVGVRSTSGAPSSIPAAYEADKLFLDIDVANAFTLAGVYFKQNGKGFQVKSGGSVQSDLNPTTGVGTEVGTLDQSRLTMDVWAPGSNPAISDFRGLAAPPVTGPFSPFGGFQVMFRTAVAPLRPSSVNILGTLRDGTTVNVSSNDDGIINTTRVKGRVDYDTGVVDLFAVSPTATIPGQETTDLSYLQIPGVTNVYLDQFKTDTLRYNAVAYTYLPLNSELLGLDPVRLPSDGRVPIFEPGYVLVFGRTERETPATLSNGNVLTAGPVRLSHARLIDANGAVIHTGYTVNLALGTLTVTSTAGWVQPVVFEHRIEDMVQARDAQINGLVSFLPALSHEFPADGKSYCSSALAFGDLISRVSLLFDLQTFDASYSDTPGTGATAQFDDTNAPIEVTNSGAVTEKWSIVFTSTTSFVVRGQHLGQIGLGSVTEDCAPINTNTGAPYFLIPKEGWGAGWSTGNTLRFNTVACGRAFWTLRTVRQGPPAGEDYSFELLPRGGIDNPL